jgi:hypothetical protein
MDIKIEDGSGDRKYFAMIPYYILNHSTAIDQALYLHLKRYAGENGQSFASHNTLMEKMGVGRKALTKSLNYLIEHAWIDVVGYKDVTTPGGIQKIKVYKVNDMWRQNIDYYEGLFSGDVPISQGGSKRTPLAKGGSQSTPKVVPEDTLIRNIINKKITAETSSARKKEVTFNPLGSEIIKALEAVDPKNKTYYGNKSQRAACDFLLNEHPLTEILHKITFLPKLNILPFFPKIYSPYDLKEKWQKLEDTLKTKQLERTTNQPMIFA